MSEEAPLRVSSPGGDLGESPQPKIRATRRAFLKGVAFGGALVGIQLYQGRDAPRGAAPALDTVPLGLGPLEAPRLVYFWATWCGVCHAMEHNIRAFEEARIVTMVASASGSPSEVRSWLNAENKSLAGVVVDDGRNARAWGVNAYPTTFVLNSQGEIRDVCVGYTTELGLRLRLALAG